MTGGAGIAGASRRVLGEVATREPIEGSLEVHGAERAAELAPAVLRLGLGAPALVASQEPLRETPGLDALREVERVGAHLGGLEARLALLGPEPRAVLTERLGRVRLLSELAGALADLREVVRDRRLAGSRG